MRENTVPFSLFLNLMKGCLYMIKRFTSKEDIVNPNSVCIFADSSFARYPKSIESENDDTKYVGDTAPAYCIYIGNHLVEQWYNIVPNLTSQEGEHYAILLAIQAAYRYRFYPKINIFSDSLTTVCALRERNIRYMYNDPERLARMNQQYLVEPVYAIIQNGFPIEFYHVPGHVNIRGDKDAMLRAKESFEHNNPWVGKVDLPLIRFMAMGNCTVDEYSTTMLRSYLDARDEAINTYNHYSDPIHYFYQPFNNAQIAQYKSLVCYSKDKMMDGIYYDDKGYRKKV